MRPPAGGLLRVFLDSPETDCRIRDQRYLPAAGLTQEILLRQQELATDYRSSFRRA